MNHDAQKADKMRKSTYNTFFPVCTGTELIKMYKLGVAICMVTMGWSSNDRSGQ